MASTLNYFLDKEEALKEAELTALAKIENILSAAKTFKKIRRNVLIFSKRLKRSTRGDVITCDKVRHPAKALQFPTNQASEIVDPLRDILKKYSNCGRFGDFQNRLIRLQDSLLKAIRKSD